MKTIKTFTIILSSSVNKSPIQKFMINNTLGYIELSKDLHDETGRIWEYQHIYIVSDDKYIASTDEICTPDALIPKSFIDVYIKAYNERSIIREVSLEMCVCECGSDKHSCGNYNYDNECTIVDKVKTREDKTVIIHKVKESSTYTKEEVEILMKKAWSNGYVFGLNDIEDDDIRCKKFIKENLK